MKLNLKVFFPTLKRIDKHIVTDIMILQIWTLLVYGRVRIPSFPTQRFSEYTRQTSICRQRLGKQLLSLQRMLTKVSPVITRITEENLPFVEVSYIRYGRIGFKEHSDSQNFSYKGPVS
jgi:hypothetical protein